MAAQNGTGDAGSDNEHCPPPDPLTIQEGDRALFLIKGKQTLATIQGKRVKAGSISIPASALIGTCYGKQNVAGMDIIILPATPKDHMENLDRGPQVIMPGDASTILFYGDVRSGKTVLEAGSGSGSLTIALASAVGREGVVFSFDNRPRSTEIARKNITRSGFSQQVIFHTGDVKDSGEVGSILADHHYEKVDSMVLDMPDPWEALDTIRNVLKIGGILVCYLPTMNQVERLRGALKDSVGPDWGFVDIHTHETIRRELVVKPGAVRPDYSMLGHTAYLTFARRY